MNTDPYLDPATGILTNILGITDAAALRRAETDISAVRLIQLAARPLPGSYDLPHLQAFHATIFGDVYPWAGQLRTINIFKTTGFCPPQNIHSYATDMFAKLAAENHLRDLPREEFTDRLAHYYSEINELHPFSEGNGRTQRAFLTQLAEDVGHRLDWTTLDADVNTTAAIAAHKGDLTLTRQLLATAVIT